MYIILNTRIYIHINFNFSCIYISLHANIILWGQLMKVLHARIVYNIVTCNLFRG